MRSHRPSSQPLPGLRPQVKLPAAPLTTKPKGTVPLKTAPAPASKPSGGNQPLMGTLDMSNWDRDPTEIYKLLNNKELPNDEYRGTV